MTEKPKRGIATVPDIRARSIVDPLTGCWHYQGSTRIHTFDYRRGDKTDLNLPLAVWMIAHGQAPLRGHLAFRRCLCTDCVNPVHIALAPSKKAIGLHVSRFGVWKGMHVDVRRANAAKGRAAQGRIDTPAEIVAIIRETADTIPAAAMAAQLGLNESTIFRIRRGERRATV